MAVMLRACGQGICAVLLAACGRLGFEPGANTGPQDDAGQLDVGDGAPGVDAAVACPSFAILCDDFESGDLGAWTNVLFTGPATATVSGTRVHAGSFSLDAAVGPDPSDNGAAAPRLRIAPVSSGVLAVRQWINMTTPLVNFNLVAVLTDYVTDHYVTAGGNSTAEWVSTEDIGTGSIDHHTTIATPAVGTWVCVELVFSFPGVQAATIEVFVDNVLVLQKQSADAAPMYNEVQVGIPRSDEAGFRVFVDDVVIASQRIGCG